MKDSGKGHLHIPMKDGGIIERVSHLNPDIKGKVN